MLPDAQEQRGPHQQKWMMKKFDTSPLPAEYDELPPWRSGRYSYYANQKMFSDPRRFLPHLGGPPGKIYRTEL